MGARYYGDDDEPPHTDSMQAAHKVFHEACRVYGGGMPEDYGPDNPAKSAKQQRFMGSELNRAKKGKKTKTGMGKSKLREMAAKPKGGY
jgi:hypothetical protein